MDDETWMALCERLQGKEVMVWTTGGHFFRGFMKGWDARAVVVEKVSCPLADGERGERDWVIILTDQIDAIS
jgi:small nuclear ribonucleoprotein (snRNP)-like protein